MRLTQRQANYVIDRVDSWLVM